MSLLIKALASAEKAKQTESAKRAAASDPSAGLMLESLPETEITVLEQQDSAAVAEITASKEDAFNVAAAASLEKVRQQSELKKDSSQQTAANVFVASQMARKPASMPVLVMLGVTGAVLIWGALQVYQYLKQPEVSPAVMPPVLPVPAQVMARLDDTQLPVPASESQTVVAPAPVAELPVMEPEIALASKPVQQAVHPDMADTSLFAQHSDPAQFKPENSPRLAVKKMAEQSVVEAGELRNIPADEPKTRAPMQLVTRTPAAGVDPVLLSAYQAYSRGDDAAAQTQYRQVLREDVRNVDALLGMAAIAARQSRYADARGWYQKVLEIEPRNAIALSAIANLEISRESAGAVAAETDYLASESRIKNMLAQQPDSANLHAALGNLYALRNQWGLAQAAYFDASNHAPNSADYAFNLAVSLDQLGKSALALAQYQRALDLLQSSGTGKLDKAQLEARIKALQE